MTVPYSLVVIKPLSVGRGNAPDILAAILNRCPVTLRKFRVWSICATTLQALADSNNRSVFPAVNRGPSWVCLFTHLDRETDPTPILDDFFGSATPNKVMPGTLRYTYGGFTNFGPTAHPSDDVVHLSHASRVKLEADLLFTDFDSSKV